MPEDSRSSLEALTLAVCKTLNQVPPECAKDKKFARLLKELEIINDSAMQSGLGLPVHRIAQLKTRTRRTSAKPASTAPRVLTPFQQLMDHHAKHLVGPIPAG